MRHTKTFILLTALLLCGCLSALALAGNDGPLSELWNSGCDLLFRTDNVTAEGEAVFALDGEVFKTARLHYVQDGYNSFYGLGLLTPRADGSIQETGWTIIADEEGDYAVMEAYTPGIYRMGCDNPHNTLLRRTVQLDGLVNLGGLLAGQLELPEGALTVTEEAGVKHLRLALAEDQIPELAVSALNLAAEYLSNRWFAFGYDRCIEEDEGVPFENYITVTQALTDGTVRWTLRSAEADFALDAQGRLTDVSGTVRVASTFWDGAVREVTVQFQLTLSGYGSSHVKAFDPADYGVVLPREYYEENDEPDWSLTEEAWQRWVGKAEALLEGQGFALSPDADIMAWRTEDTYRINIANPDGEDYFLVYQEDGSLMTLQAMTEALLSAEGEGVQDVEADTIEAARQFALSFVQEQNPLLAEKLNPLNPQDLMTAPDGTQYLTFEDGESCYFVVRVAPALRMEYYEGAGNG